jgi:DNA-binding response OmpR family regulator
MKILIVDDSESYSLKQLIGKWFPGFEIDTAETSQDAIQKIHENEYSFVTMDGVLGVCSEMDGLETVREIRKFDKSLLIIMMSNAYIINEEGIKAGANVSIGKIRPSEKEAFLAVLKLAGISL